MSREAEKADTKEIEITPEMIEAGKDALFGIAHLADGDSKGEIVREVYLSMETARRLSSIDHLY